MSTISKGELELVCELDLVSELELVSEIKDHSLCFIHIKFRFLIICPRFYIGQILLQGKIFW